MTQIQTLAIGAAHEGGFYAGQLRLGDALVALIVAPKAEGERRGLAWLPKYDDVPGARSCFDGMANTVAMAEAGSEIANWARGLAIAGHSDWYIPSRDELELIYRNLKPTAQRNSCSFRDGDNASSVPAGYPYTEELPAQTDVAAFQAGGEQALEADWYWSSTQYSAGTAFVQFFNSGSQSYGDKKFEGWGRAVRRLIL